MVTFLLAWYFACIGPAGYDQFSEKTCGGEFKTFEKALNFKVGGWYDIPFRDKRY